MQVRRRSQQQQSLAEQKLNSNNTTSSKLKHVSYVNTSGVPMFGGVQRIPLKVGENGAEPSHQASYVNATKPANHRRTHIKPASYVNVEDVRGVSGATPSVSTSHRIGGTMLEDFTPAQVNAARDSIGVFDRRAYGHFIYIYYL